MKIKVHFKTKITTVYLNYQNVLSKTSDLSLWMSCLYLIWVDFIGPWVWTVGCIGWVEERTLLGSTLGLVKLICLLIINSSVCLHAVIVSFSQSLFKSVINAIPPFIQTYMTAFIHSIAVTIIVTLCVGIIKYSEWFCLLSF